MSATRSTIPLVHDVELVALDTLKPHPRNYRRHPPEQLAHLRQSLREHGVYRNVVVAVDSTILAGHGVVEAALEEQLDAIAVVRLPILPDDPKALKLVAADNELPRLALDDDRALAQLLEEIRDDDDVGLYGTGYEDEDLAQLLASLDEQAQLDADDVDDEPRQRYTFDVFTREQIIDAAFAHYRAVGFPYRETPLHVCMSEINDLRVTPLDALQRSNLGYRVADHYHPHRWSAKIDGKANALDIFADDRLLRIALEHVLDYGLTFSPPSFAGMLGLTRGAQAASNFRPGFALQLLRRYAHSDAVVFDASTGYGGRLVAFIASQCSEYVGVDPSTKTHDANARLVADLCPADKRVELHCVPAEDLDVEIVRERCDVALTSPPYFVKERYCDESTQSCVRYPDPEAWRDQFLRPLLALQHAALKPGATNLLNIADVTIKSKTIPLLQWALDAARDVGFDVLTIESYALQQHFGKGIDKRITENGVATEPLIVMRKP